MKEREKRFEGLAIGCVQSLVDVVIQTVFPESPTFDEEVDCSNTITRKRRVRVPVKKFISPREGEKSVCCEIGYEYGDREETVLKSKQGCWEGQG